MTVPTLQTARLTLRALQRSDLDDVVRLVNDFAVSQWLTMVPYPYGPADAAEFLHLGQSGALGPLWVITRDGAMLGVVSVDAELGYWLGTGAWGQGYMTEACQAVITHHFATTSADAIHVNYLDGNLGSRRVLDKLGFVTAGTTCLFSRSQGKDMPGHSMVLTRARWQDLRSAAQ